MLIQAHEAVLTGNCTVVTVGCLPKRMGTLCTAAALSALDKVCSNELSRFHSGEKATIDDWEAHLSTVFPDVRMKKFLEMRGADGGPWKMICAMPALWVGLLYDRKAQEEAL